MENAVNTFSSPSDLKITDIRYAVVWSNYDYPIIRVDTNQGVYGIGEVRDAGHLENALQFKSILLGQNPCNVDMIFNSRKKFGNWGREGGVSGIEIALWDLVGKVYGVPCYQFLGGKYRDKVRIYADTPEPDDSTPEAYAQRALGRKQMGLTFIKCDVRMQTLREVAGAMVGQPTRHECRMNHRWQATGTGSVVKVPDKGIQSLAEVIGLVCIDHYGHGYLTVNEVVKLVEALEPYSLAWMEDPMPTLDVADHKRVTDAVRVPIAVGEDW